MRRIIMTLLVSAIACLSMGCPAPDTVTAPTTLRELTYVDMYAPGYHTSRPLLCGESRRRWYYYPGGTEMIFKRSNQEGEVHAVFPKGIAAPLKGDLDKAFVLHGRFEAIKSTPDGKALEKPARPVKLIPYGYQYFVVSSWQCK